MAMDMYAVQCQAAFAAARRRSCCLKEAHELQALMSLRTVILRSQCRALCHRGTNMSLESAEWRMLPYPFPKHQE